MPKYIVKMQKYYFEWSTIVDAPVTFGMTLKEFTKYYRREYGKRESYDLAQRLERVQQNGTSSRLGHTPSELFACNRAGPEENCLTEQEIFMAYCLRKAIRDGWTVPTMGLITFKIRRFFRWLYYRFYCDGQAYRGGIIAYALADLIKRLAWPNRSTHHAQSRHHPR